MPLNKNLDSGLSSCLAGTTKRDSSRVCCKNLEPYQRELIEESSGGDDTPKVKSRANEGLRFRCRGGRRPYRRQACRRGARGLGGGARRQSGGHPGERYCTA